MLKIIEKDNKKVAIMALSGDPLGEPDAELVRQKTRQIVQSKIRHVVFDMSGVRHINSAGLGGLVSAFTTLRKVGGTVQLSNVVDPVRRIFNITRLDELFPMCDSVDEAIGKWGNDSA
jgi:anti-sigma B factor antagonist